MGNVLREVEGYPLENDDEKRVKKNHNSGGSLKET
jgi:hypothetical protein